MPLLTRVAGQANQQAVAWWLRPLPMRLRCDDDPIVSLRSSMRMGGDMPLITVVVTRIVVGVLLWLIRTYVPMDSKIKILLDVVVVIAVVLWLPSAFGLIGHLGNIKVGRG
jgi:hypothetical protein